MASAFHSTTDAMEITTVPTARTRPTVVSVHISKTLLFFEPNLLGPVAPISVNFNHQLAYFADHSDTTHVRHQPTAVA